MKNDPSQMSVEAIEAEIRGIEARLAGSGRCSRRLYRLRMALIRVRILRSQLKPI